MCPKMLDSSPSKMALDPYSYGGNDVQNHGVAAWHGQVGQALQLEPCEDPLHSVAARDAVDKKAGVYEAVNKPPGPQRISGWTCSGWRMEEGFCLMVEH